MIAAFAFVACLSWQSPASSPAPPARVDLPRIAPSGGEVLYNGRGSEALRMKDGGGPVTWDTKDGALEVDQEASDVVSVKSYGDCLLHLEWLSPPGGQLGRQLNGNSGVKLQSRYEIQITNLAGPPTETGSREAGAIYNFKRPDHNASTGPGTWQVFDIWFTAPRWSGDEKTANARMTVYWNAVLVHDDVELPDKTGWSPAEAPGTHPVLLQSHKSDAEDDVRFRNVWIVPDPAAHGLHPPGRSK